MKLWKIMLLAVACTFVIALIAESAEAYNVAGNTCVGCSTRYQSYHPYTNYYYGSYSYGYNGWGFNKVQYNQRFPYYRHYYPYAWHYPYAYNYYPSPMYRQPAGYGGFGGGLGGYGGYGGGFSPWSMGGWGGFGGGYAPGIVW